MTLTFLGRKYEATLTTIETSPSEQIGKYRGNPVRFSTAQAVPHATQQLTYRGIAYNR